MYVINITHHVAWSLVEPYLPLYAKVLGAEDSSVGLMAATWAVFPALAALPCGVLADRVGAKPILLAGALATTGAFVLLLHVPGMAAVFLAQGLAGVGQVLLALATQTQVVLLESNRADRLGFHFGYITFSVSLSKAIGPSAGGLMLEAARNLRDPLEGYRLMFMAVLGLSLVTVAAALASRQVKSRGRPKNLWEELQETTSLATSRSMSVPLIISFLSLVSLGLRRSFLPLYLSNIGFSSAAIGLFFGVHDLSSMSTRAWFGRGVTWLGYKRLLALTLLAGALAWGTVPLWRSMAMLLLIAALAGISTGVSQPLSMVLVAGAATSAQQGTAVSLRLFVNRLGQLLSPIMFGAVATVVSVNAAFYAFGLALAGINVLARRLYQEAPAKG